MTRYEVTLNMTATYYVETDLPADQLEQRISDEIETRGPGWAEDYDPWMRELWEKHPRKYAAQRKNAPPADMTVEAPDIPMWQIDVTHEAVPA